MKNVNIGEEEMTLYSQFEDAFFKLLKTAERKFYNGLEQSDTLTTGASTGIKKTKVCVALSGGADSMFLMSLMYALSKVHNDIEIIPVIVDHQLRKESEQEARDVKDYVEGNFAGMNPFILTWIHDDIPNKSTINGIQEKARNKRYELLTQHCITIGAHYICTGHNKDDNTETMLMNMMRGSGISGLCGIPKVSIRNKVTILRPLLHFSRKTIEMALRNSGISWVNDPTNQNTKYTRNKIRNFIKLLQTSSLISYDLFIERTNLLSNHICSTNDYINSLLENELHRICIFLNYGAMLVNHEELINLHPEIRFRIIKLVLKLVSGNEEPVRSEKIQTLIKRLLAYTEEVNSMTLAGCEIIKIEENKKNKDNNISHILFIKEASTLEKQLQIIDLSSGTTPIMWDNNFAIRYENIQKSNLIRIHFYPFFCFQNISRNFGHYVDLKESNIKSIYLKNPTKEDVRKMQSCNLRSEQSLYLKNNQTLNNIRKKNYIHQKILLTIPLLLY